MKRTVKRSQLRRDLLARARMEGDSAAAVTQQEITDAIAGLNSAFAEFRTKNDEALAEIRAGNDDVVRREELDRINGEMNDRQSELEELNRRIAAASINPGEGDAVSAEDRAHTESIVNYMRTGQEPQMVASVDSDPDGGYTVGHTMEAGIDRVVGTFGAMRQIATVRSIGSNFYRKLRGLGGATSGWVGEKTARPETNTPTLQQLDFPTHEIYANPMATQTLLDDGEVDIAAWLADEVGIEFAEEEGSAFVDGDGDNKPRGLIGGYTPVVNASFDNANPRLGYIVTGVSGAFGDGGSPESSGGDELLDLVYALNRKFRQNGSFLMNDLTLSEVRKLKDADGNYIWQPSLQAGQPSQLLGYGVNVDDYMDDIAADSFSIAFGDFRKAYLIVDRVGVRVLRDPYTNKPYVGFYTTKRVGGGIQDFEAAKLLKFGTS